MAQGETEMERKIQNKTTYAKDKILSNVTIELLESLSSTFRNYESQLVSLYTSLDTVKDFVITSKADFDNDQSSLSEAKYRLAARRFMKLSNEISKIEGELLDCCDCILNLTSHIFSDTTNDQRWITYFLGTKYFDEMVKFTEFNSPFDRPFVQMCSNNLNSLKTHHTISISAIDELHRYNKVLLNTIKIFNALYVLNQL